MKSIFVITLFIIFTVLISKNAKDSMDKKWQKCNLLEKILYINFAYFSEHGYRHIKTTTYSELVSEAQRNESYLSLNEQRFLSLCLCRVDHGNQTFFISPYTVPEKDEFHDAVIFCLTGDDGIESVGKYDENELYDILMMERIQAVPNSVINPFGVEEYKDNDEPACYDFYGFPIKNVLGQKTCLLAVEISNENSYIYSGPLMGNAMIMDSMEYCYSSVKSTDLQSYNKDYCSMSMSSESVKLQCCCAHSPHLCSPKGLTNKNKAEQLYCVSGFFQIIKNGTFNDNLQTNSSLQEYINKYVNFSCHVVILARYLETERNFDIAVSYGAQSKCDNETTYEIYNEFCSFAHAFPREVSMSKCCKDEHFCNQRLITQKIQPLYCFYKPNNAAYLLDETRCETFFDIWENQSVFSKLIFNYNAKTPKNQKKYVETPQFGFEYRYVYYQIIKEDNCTSEKRYNTSNVNQYRPFFHVLCTTLDKLSPCDRDHTVSPKNLFECEHLDLILFDEAQKGYPTATKGGWICFVQILYVRNDGKNYIGAGELKDFTNHVECLEKDVINEMFCCSHIFLTTQNETECTVKNLIEYNRKLRESDQSKSGYENKFFSNCFIRELPLDSCPSESGCFETRMLEYSKNSDSLEPAGCIDNTEKYITEDNSLASVSLGCRVPENSNKCSVISSVDGNQRILCCCNGEECKNDATNLPKEIGKKISSFKDPK